MTDMYYWSGLGTYKKICTCLQHTGTAWSPSRSSVGSGSGATTATAAASTTSTAASATTTALTISGSSVDGLLVLLEPVGVLGKGRSVSLSLAPKVGGEILVGLSEALEDGLDEVLTGSGVTSGSSVNIIDTSKGEEFLGDGGTDNSSSSGSGGKLDSDGASLSGDLGGNGMDSTDLVTPISSSDGDEGELGGNEGSLNGDLDFLGNLDSETDVTVLVTDGNNSLKAGSLSGLGLLLDGDDLHDLVGKGLALILNKLLNNRGFFDGNGVRVDLLEGLDESVLYESSELGDGSPFILGGTTGASSAAAVSSTASTSAESSSSATFSSFSLGSVASCTFHNACLISFI